MERVVCKGKILVMKNRVEQVKEKVINQSIIRSMPRVARRLTKMM